MQRALIPSVALLLVGVFLGAATDAEAQRRRRRQQQRTEPATLVVQSTIEGAEVLVDEEFVGLTPLDGPLEVTPGPHTIRVRRAGYTEFTDVVRVQPGERLEVPVDLFALSMVLTVRTDPDQARVFVDGTFRGTTPLEVELVEGEHSLRITHPTHREVIRQVVARAGQTEALDVTLEAMTPSELGVRTPEWYEDPLVWVGVGVGAAVVAIAIVVLAVVLGEGGSQVDAFCPATDSGCLHIMPWQ